MPIAEPWVFIALLGAPPPCFCLRKMSVIPLRICCGLEVLLAVKFNKMCILLEIYFLDNKNNH